MRWTLCVLLSCALLACGDASPGRDATNPAVSDEAASVGSGAAQGFLAVNASPPPALDAPAAAVPMPGQDPAAPPMVIRTGHVTVEVDSLEVAANAVRALARRLGGYVANSSVMGGADQQREAMFELKIPAQRFDEALSGLGSIGQVESANVAAQDVGEEFVDVTARVANARRLEERLVDLLANRTGKLDDVLKVERELARVREEVERFEGRLRYLRSRTAVSTLAVRMHEDVPVIGPQGGGGVIGDAFRQAWRNFIGFVAGAVALSGVLIPVAILGFAAFILIRRFRRATPPAA